MARRSQCSSAGDNPLDPNYLPPHYREEYRLAVDALVEDDVDGYYHFLVNADVVDFLSPAEIEFIQRSVRVPQHIEHHEQRFLEAGVDGSSDTYWPLHSDLDAPGLDLGWPHIHHFIGPTEVTTLVNPAEPDMPSIKEQARRLIKNAQQVVAIVMDMFTDVDIFADILNAAMRNVAVYVLLDKENCHHFLNMVANCRVDLTSIQFLRVRTVSGIKYHCRSGKSFRGQMMDRFLLTDCRAVLSGNYSFMWSFEKLHRCMAHLFLGQLVTTFDEEFRILFAQSEPLIVENVLPPTEDFGLLQKRPHPSERPLLYRQPRKFLSLDTAHPDDRARHSLDDRVDADPRMKPMKGQDIFYGGAEVYSRFPSQQPRYDPAFDPSSSKLQMENPAFKRHSYAEGGHGRYSYPFLQGAPEHEGPGRPRHRGPPPFTGAERETDYSGYDRFWNQDFHQVDQYSEPGLPPETELHQDFDPVMSYLSSSRKHDFDQSSENLPAELFTSSQQRRLSLGQLNTSQVPPTALNPPEQKPFYLEPNMDRKDPTVKRGLRNWRINSYLSAYDNPADEGLPSTPPNAPDPFEDPSDTLQQTSGVDLSFPKIPNVREFKIPALPRASQMPSYAKTTPREPPKKTVDEPPAGTAETKPTPTPSESSSTTEGEKSEEAEPREPRTLQREDSFRRQHNAAVQRSSRLRSSLIFSTLEQQHTADTKTPPGQLDEDTMDGQKKPSYISPVFGQRRSAGMEWSRYIKSSAQNNNESKLDDGNCNAEEKDKLSKDLSENSGIQESLNPPAEEKVDSSAPQPQSKPPEAQPPKTGQTHKPSLTAPMFLDMTDPDNRLMFFKELAAQRKAAKAAEAAEAEKNKVLLKTAAEPKTASVKKEETTTPSEKTSDLSTSAEKAALVGHLVDPSNKTNEDFQSKSNTKPPQSSNDKQTRVSTDSEKAELKNSQSDAALHVSTDTEIPRAEASQEQQSNTAMNDTGLSHPPTQASPANIPSPARGEPGTAQLEPSSQDTVKIPSTGSAPFPSSAQNRSSEVLISTQTTTILKGNESISPSEPSESAKETFSLRQTQSESRKPPLHSSTALSETCLAALSGAESEISLGSCVSSLETSAKTQSVEKRVPQTQNTLAVIETSGKIEAASLSHLPEDSHLESESRKALEEKITDPPSEQAAPPPEPHLSPVASCPAKTGSSSSSLSPEAEPTRRHSDYVSLHSPKNQMPIVPSEEPSDRLTSAEIESAGKKDSPVTAGDPQKVSPVPAERYQQDSPLPAVDSQKNLPVPSEDSEIDSTVPVQGSQKDSPLPAVDLNKGPPVPAEDSQKDLPLPAEDSLKDSSVLTEDSQKDSSVLTEDSQKDSSVLTEDSQKDSSVLTEDSQKDSVLTENSQKDSSVLTEDSQKDSSVLTEDSQKDSPVPEDDSQKDSAGEKTDTEPKSIDSNSLIQKTKGRGTELQEIPEEVPPVSPQSKLTKSNTSRYISSTANVLSSSNLRDDTKLLLEQISANSQSRNEATKESAVTDDEKEDENDKNAKKGNLRGFQALRGPPKSEQEREKVLERIQSMRKERKVYSRFEMAP